MSDVKGIASNTATFAIAASTMTLIQLTAPANQRLRVKEVSVSFNGIDPAGPKIPVRHMVDVVGGTGTALTLVKENAGDDELLQSTAKENFTVEPTGGRQVFRELVHPQGGYTWRGQRAVKGGGNITLAIGPGTIGGTARIEYEE